MQSDERKIMKCPEGNSWSLSDVEALLVDEVQPLGREGKRCRLPPNKAPKKGNLSTINPGMFQSDKTNASMPSALSWIQIMRPVSDKKNNNTSLMLHLKSEQSCVTEIYKGGGCAFSQPGSQGRADSHSGAPYSAKAQGHALLFQGCT